MSIIVSKTKWSIWCQQLHNLQTRQQRLPRVWQALQPFSTIGLGLSKLLISVALELDLEALQIKAFYCLMIYTIIGISIQIISIFLVAYHIIFLYIKLRLLSKSQLPTKSLEKKIPLIKIHKSGFLIRIASPAEHSDLNCFKAQMIPSYLQDHYIVNSQAERYFIYKIERPTLPINGYI